jgi:predicted glycosyltransferase
MGLVDLLHPDLLAPNRLTQWLNKGRETVTPPHGRINLNGAARLVELVEALLVRALSAHGRSFLGRKMRYVPA